MYDARTSAFRGRSEPTLLKGWPAAGFVEDNSCTVIGPRHSVVAEVLVGRRDRTR
jgi:hypothetical protein